MKGIGLVRDRGACLAAVGLALIGLAGCRGDPTTVVIQVNTNLSVRTEVDEIVIILPGTNIDAEPDRHFKLESASDLPVVLGLYPSGDPTVEIDLSARAQWLGEVVVEERRQTGFVPGRIERLTIDLISPCHDVTCPSDQVCDHNLGTCVDSDGGAPPVDGGDADGATGP